MKKTIIAAALATSIAASAQVNSPSADGYRDRGVNMYSDHNYIGCIDQMQHLKELSGQSQLVEDADYYIALASTHLKRVDSPALLKYFLWKYPTSVRCLEIKLTLAEMALDAGEYKSALSQLNGIDPDRLDALQSERLRYAKAVALLKCGNLNEAAPMFQSLTSTRRFGNDAKFYTGYIAYANGDMSRAKTLLSAVDTSHMPARMADYYLAQIAFADRDFSRALSLARKLTSSKTDVGAEYAAEAMRIAGESQYNLGNDSEAVATLKKYVSMTDSPLPSALYILGIEAYRSADYDKAIEYLAQPATLDSAMGQSSLLTLGEALIAKGEYSRAMIPLDRAYRMDFDPEIKETALYNYAVASTEGGRVPFGSTVSTFEEFLRNFPSSPYADSIREYLVKGYITDNNLPAALASINAVANPSDRILKAKQIVLYTLGTREYASGALNQAEAHLTEAISLARHDESIAAEANLWLGDVEYAKTDYAKAEKAYLAALKSKSLAEANKPLATYNLGYTYFNMADYPKATERFSQFVTAPGQSSKTMVADAYSRIADAQFVNSQFAKAADTYAKAYELSHDTGDYPLYQLAITKGLTSNLKGKTADMLSLISKYPDSPLVPQALLETGLTYDQLRMPDKTIETYSQLAARYPATQQGRQAQLLMALAYINNGDTPQAIDTYKKLITSSATSEEATQAVESLKTLLAEQGKISEFTKFMSTVPTARQVDINDLEATAFAAAERQYLDNGTTARLTEYIEQFPSGANLPQALAYAMKANYNAGNNRMAMAYASRLINDFPDNAATPQALLTMAETQVALGKGEEALESYVALREKASTPQLVNSALLGVMHTARDLDKNDMALEAAETLMKSSTPTAAQRSDATFTRGLVLSRTGRGAEAIEQWSEISSDLNDINGTKAAFYIAQQQFDDKKLDEARRSTEALIDSDTPHIYWLARAFILLSDIHRASGNDFEAEEYLKSLRENYPGTESDIINLIDQRLNKSK